MNAVKCPHCEYVNTIDGAKPGQRVECVACDAPFRFDPTKAVAPPPTAELPRTSLVEQARVDYGELAYQELRKINARLDEESRKRRNIGEAAAFFMALAILWPLIMLVAAAMWGGPADRIIVSAVALPWLIGAVVAGVIARLAN